MFCDGCSLFVFFFFFNDTATTEIYTLSLHDALPIRYVGYPSSTVDGVLVKEGQRQQWDVGLGRVMEPIIISYYMVRSEEHTSELQSHSDLVCRLLLEKKKKREKNPCNETIKTKKKHNIRKY